MTGALKGGKRLQTDSGLDTHTLSRRSFHTGLAPRYRRALVSRLGFSREMVLVVSESAYRTLKTS